MPFPFWIWLGAGSGPFCLCPYNPTKLVVYRRGKEPDKNNSLVLCFSLCIRSWQGQSPSQWRTNPIHLTVEDYCRYLPTRAPFWDGWKCQAMLRVSKARRWQRHTSSLITPEWAGCAQVMSRPCPDGVDDITMGETLLPAKTRDLNYSLSIWQISTTLRGPTTVWPSASHLAMSVTDQQHSQSSCFS